MNLGRDAHIQSTAMVMPFTKMGTQKKYQLGAGCMCEGADNVEL